MRKIRFCIYKQPNCYVALLLVNGLNLINPEDNKSKSPVNVTGLEPN